MAARQAPSRSEPYSASPPIASATGSARLRWWIGAALVALPVAAPAAGQAALERPQSSSAAAEAPAPRRTVTPDDYGRFESLGTVGLSDDGRWIGVVINRADEDGEVRFGTAAGGELRVVERGGNFQFTSDGAWIGVAIEPEEDAQPSRNDLLLIPTGGGEEHTIDGVQSFAFSPDGRFVLMRKYRPNGNGAPAAAGRGGGGRGGGANGGAQAAGGVDVLVRDLATGTDVAFGNVSESSWAPDGALLATITDADGMAGNGVRLYDPATGRIRTLHSATSRYSGLTWRDDSRDLAALRMDPDTVRGDTIHTVLAWRDVGRDGTALLELQGAFAGADGRELRTTAARGLDWADDGSRLFVAVQERAEAEEEEEDEGARGRGEGAGRAGGQGRGGDEPQVPGVEIWHAKDVDPIPQQRLRVNQDRRRSALGAWDLSGPVVVLGGDGLDEGISLLAGQRHALLTDQAPYGAERMFGPVFRDFYVVDVATGERKLAAERIESSQGSSPGGRYLLFFKDDHHWVYDVQSGETRNITAGVQATFANQEVDRPVTDVAQRPSYGVGGWTEGDRHVLLYDRFDVWRVRPDGQGGERITRGAEDDVRHRMVRLDDEDAYPADGPWWVSLYGEYTKNTGYGRVQPGREVQRLAWEPSDVGRLMQSEDGSRLAFVTERVDQSPAVHVADRNLGSARQVTRTNAFADEFSWGKGELIDYTNAWGRRLQGALHYPANYEPGRRYPMIVYHYELRSQQLHAWSNPSERSAYNTTVFTQNGYFVLQPDIVYRPRNPGLSFMEAVIPAVDAAIATGMIDPERVGITGHSWGGYQTTFAVTQTDRFAAAVAGAPLTNLESMYLSFYWNSGSTDARIFEISQGRMEVPWWLDEESYHANSPVHHIQNMTTPLLMAFGTEDGAVEFNQGVEFYNAARRENKDFVLLVYEGENHSLAREPNQIDYHRRSLEWFNHYLKGAPAPKWITDGLRYTEQQDELQKGPAEGRVPVPTPATVSSAGGGG